MLKKSSNVVGLGFHHIPSTIYMRRTLQILSFPLDSNAWSIVNALIKIKINRKFLLTCNAIKQVVFLHLELLLVSR
jgi:hypothetical protein